MEDFPPNSRVSKGEGPGRVREPRQRVTQADAVRRKPSLGKKFAQTFITGDAPRMAWDYMIWESMIPAARDLIVEGLQDGIARLFNGGQSRRPGIGRSPYGVTTYNRMFRGAEPQHYDRSPLPTQQQMLSRPARARHSFDEIILQTRQDAEEVLDRMYDILGSQYEVVTVADLYELVGITPTHVDTTWGWTDLRGATVGRVRGLGYLLDLPEPEHLGR